MSSGRAPVGRLTPLVGACVCLAVAVATAAVLQIRTGLWHDPGMPLVVGVGLLVAAALAPLALRPARGVLPGFGLSALAVAQVLVIASTGTGTSLVVVLAVWVPAAAVGLALLDESQRVEGEPAAAAPGGWSAPAGVARGTTGGGVRRPGDNGRRALAGGLAAALTVALLAAVATVVIRPPARTAGPGGRDAGRFWSGVARSGRPATGLGIYQAADELDIGRRVPLGDEVVMRVRADSPDFWRGTSYDSWDGRTWSRTDLPAGVADPTDRPAGGAVTSSAGPTPLGEDSLLQVFTVVSGASDLLFGAYRARSYVSPDQYRSDSDGTTTVAEPLGPGARYAVLSSRPTVTESLLRQLDPVAAATELPDDVRRRYLQLPADVPDRVLRLAADVTAGQPTAYDRIRALEAWMGANTTYTLDIPPLPDGADAVDQFLFVDRRGYCEQIATSLAVMLRSLGVPARLGVGYAPGERRWGTDEYVVRSRDAHAWVEVWFPGVGWQAFDPTARVPLSGASDAGHRQVALRLLVAAVAVAVVGSAAALALRRSRRRRRGWEAGVLSRLERAGGRRGRPRHPAETAAEYTRALSEGVLHDPRLVEVGAALSRAAFGPGRLDPQERQRVERVVDEAIAQAPRPARR